jgi:hypothetical protein
MPAGRQRAAHDDNKHGSGTARRIPFDARHRRVGKRQHWYSELAHGSNEAPGQLYTMQEEDGIGELEETQRAYVTTLGKWHQEQRTKAVTCSGNQHHEASCQQLAEQQEARGIVVASAVLADEHVG